MVDLVGDSTGGGMVETVTLDGFPYRTLGDAFVLLVQDPREALSDEKLERLRAELPDVVDAQTVRVDGRGVLYAFALPVEPDLAGAARGARRRRAGPAAGAAAAGAAGRQPAGPQAAALRHDDALARAGGRARRRRSGRSPSSTRWTPPAGRAAGSWTACSELALVMRRQTRAVYEEDVAVIDTEFKPDFAGRWVRHAETPARVSDGVTAQTIKYAYGAGAGIPGVENVPGPDGRRRRATSTPPSAPCRRPAA